MRRRPAVKRELPPDTSSGARSSTSSFFAVSFADSAAHKAALPPPTTITSYSSLTPRCSFCFSNDTSIRLYPGSLDDLAPLLDLFVEEPGKRLRTERIDDGAERRELLPDPGVFERLQGLRAELRNRLPGRLRRSEQAPPDVRVVSRNAGLGEGRYIGKQRNPLRAADGERAQAPRIDVGEDLDRVGDEEREAPAHEIGDRGRAALVGHVHHVDPRLVA